MWNIEELLQIIKEEVEAREISDAMKDLQKTVKGDLIRARERRKIVCSVGRTTIQHFVKGFQRF